MPKNSNFGAMNLPFYSISTLFLGLIFSLLIRINAEEPKSIPLPSVAYGKIVRFTDFPSSFVQARTIDVLLPHGYTPKQHYPVIYMHDGQMLFDNTRTWNHQEWGVDEVLEEYADSLKPCIIVGIWNNDSLRRAEYFPEKALQYIPLDTRKEFVEQELHGKPLADEYLSFIVQELKPFIERMFSANTSSDQTLLMGSSMGSLISLYALCEYPDKFGGIAGLSTHWPGSLIVKDISIAESILTYLQSSLPPSIGKKRIYLDHGTLGLDADYSQYQTHMDAWFSNAGFDATQYQSHVYEDTDHNEQAWRDRLHIPLQFLLGIENTPH